ncbi:MAG: 7-carboxy-7-deazaguanine synthase QueE [Candidatus Margulisiibacteriota bacterium]
MTETAYIKEIFPSIQGEGLYAGQPQIFLRFSNCNLDCSYCDTDSRKGEVCSVHKDAFRQKIEQIANPLSVNAVLGILDDVHIDSKILSLTGGEPLLWSDFLVELLPELKHRGWKILLETNGTLYSEFRKIAGLIDIVAMDIKLPSVGGHAPLWEQHRQFLGAIPESVRVYFKVVVNSSVSDDDIINTSGCLSGAALNRVVFLQPESWNQQFTNTDTKKILSVQSRLIENLPGYDIRILPQIHKVLSIS